MPAMVFAAFVASRAAGLLAARRVRRLTDRSMPHRAAAVSAVLWLTRAGLWATVVFMVADRLGAPIDRLLPIATILGFALGWGAQRVVLDLLAGFFFITERQFGVGDVIRVCPPGTTTGVEGAVEEMTLRIVKLRTFDGDLVSIANGELRQVSNLSRDWSRVVVDVPVALESEWDEQVDKLDAIGRAMAADPVYAPMLLDAPVVAGVEELSQEAATLRVIGRCVPGQQYKVGRELRHRIALTMSVEPRVSTSGPLTGELPVIRS
jgi:moderate conductance mechanosensitive channel